MFIDFIRTEQIGLALLLLDAYQMPIRQNQKIQYLIPDLFLLVHLLEREFQYILYLRGAHQLNQQPLAQVEPRLRVQSQPLLPRVQQIKTRSTMLKNLLHQLYLLIVNRFHWNKYKMILKNYLKMFKIKRKNYILGQTL